MCTWRAKAKNLLRFQVSIWNLQFASIQTYCFRKGWADRKSLVTVTNLKATPISGFSKNLDFGFWPILDRFHKALSQLSPFSAYSQSIITWCFVGILARWMKPLRTSLKRPWPCSTTRLIFLGNRFSLIFQLGTMPRRIFTILKEEVQSWVNFAKEWLGTWQIEEGAISLDI